MFSEQEARMPIPLPTLDARLSRAEQQVIADYRACSPLHRVLIQDLAAMFAGRAEPDTIAGRATRAARMRGVAPGRSPRTDGMDPAHVEGRDDDGPSI